MSARVFSYAVHARMHQSREGWAAERKIYTYFERETNPRPRCTHIKHTLIDTNISLWLIKSNIHWLSMPFTTPNTHNGAHKTPCITSQHGCVIIYPYKLRRRRPTLVCDALFILFCLHPFATARWMIFHLRAAQRKQPGRFLLSLEGMRSAHDAIHITTLEELIYSHQL